VKQFAVIGLGRFGMSVAITLYRMGYEVLAIDSSPEKVQAIANDVTHAVEADATDEVALKALGLSNCDVVVVAIGQDIQASILATLVLKGAGVPRVVAKAQNDLHGKVLEKVGADQVIYPERDMGVKVANNLVSANVLDHIELSADHTIAEVIVPASFEGKTLGQLNLRAKYGLNVLAIKRNEQIIISPTAEDYLSHSDIIIVLGEMDRLAKFQHKE